MNKYKLEAYESIAVIGFEHAGRKSICKAMGKPLNIYQERGYNHPTRYKIDKEKYPALKRYCLSIYSKKAQANLSMAEKHCIIVLRPTDLVRLLDEKSLYWNSYFFELLENLYWLGIHHYLICVSHIDKLKITEISDWFQKHSEAISDRLRSLYSIIIHGCIPIARVERGKFLNVSESFNSPALSWYKGPSLSSAIRSFDKLKTGSSDSLWVVGKIDKFFEPQKSINTDFTHWNVARGKLRDSLSIRLAALNAKGTFQKPAKPGDNYSIRLVNTDLINTGSDVQVITSVDVRARTTYNILAHALLDPRIPPATFAAQYNITLFGPQHIPHTYVEIHEKPNINQWNIEHTLKGSLFSTPDPKPTSSLARYVYLSITCNDRPAVAENYRKDPDAGRVILWEQPPGSRPNIVGVGQIIAFRDSENENHIQDLLSLDKARSETIGVGTPPFLQRLEMIYHGVKGNIYDWGFQQPTLEKLTRTFDSYHAEIIDIIDEVHSIRKADNTKDFSIGEPLRALRNIEKDLKRDFENIRHLFEKGEIKSAVHPFLEDLKEIYGLKTEGVRRYLRSIEKWIAECVPSEYRAVYIYNRLPKEWTFYPTQLSFFWHIKTAIKEIFRNWEKVNRLENGPNKDSFWIFIDPPDAHRPQTVRVSFICNNILTKDAYYRITESTRGIKNNVMILNRYGIETRFLKMYGACVTCIMDLPIWIHRKDGIKEIALELIELLSDIDQKSFLHNRKISDFLRRLEGILFKNKINEIPHKIKMLWQDVKEQSIVETPWTKRLRKSIEFMPVPETLIKIKGARDIIQSITNKPALSIIKDCVARLKKKGLLGQFEINIPIEKDIPHHQFKAPNLYFIIRHSIYIGLRDFIIPEIQNENKDPADINFEIENSWDSEEILIRIRIPEVEFVSKSLLPIQTHLKSLGVESESKHENNIWFQINIPVYMDLKKGGI